MKSIVCTVFPIFVGPLDQISTSINVIGWVRVFNVSTCSKVAIALPLTE